MDFVVVTDTDFERPRLAISLMPISTPLVMLTDVEKDEPIDRLEPRVWNIRRLHLYSGVSVFRQGKLLTSSNGVIARDGFALYGSLVRDSVMWMTIEWWGV